MNYKEFIAKIHPLRHPKRLPLVIPKFSNGRIDWSRVPLRTRVRIPNYIDGGVWDGIFIGFTSRNLIRVLCDDGVEDSCARTNVKIIE